MIAGMRQTGQPKGKTPKLGDMTKGIKVKGFKPIGQDRNYTKVRAPK